MDVVTVAFEVPKQIAEGLASGTLQRIGGVIRDTEGKVRLMLRETGELRQVLESGVPIPPAVTEQLNAVARSLGVVSGLQVLTLGVTVAGFAMIADRLNQIDKTLAKMLEAMNELRNDVHWMSSVRDTERAAALAAALENATWAQTHDRPAALEQARGQIVLSQSQYRMLMELMLSKEVAHRNAGVFAGFFRQHALAGLAKARCDWLLIGPSAASDTMLSVERDGQLLRKRFADPMRTFGNPVPLISIPINAHSSLLEASRALADDGARVSGYTAEIEFCRERNLNLRDWERVGTDMGHGPIAFLMPI